MSKPDEVAQGLDRRGFLGASAALAVGTVWPAAAGAEAETPHPAGTADTAAAESTAFELEESTLDQLAAGLASGRWSSEELVAKYLGRIEEIDPRTHAIAEINPDAVAIAAGLDRERRAGQVRGPLHGIPVVVKDNLGSADRMQTTAGSLALLGAIPARDAFVVEKLRAAGAVLLAKTNLSEWANFRSSRSTSGWSGRGGQVRNPYALDRNPCGSSSGSGVAASANLCPVAVGTETDGSVTCPSAMNGVVGLKPTVGLLSRSGIVPISHTQDTAGPMGRTVGDVALLLAAMTGVDVRDPATAASADRREADYRRLFSPGALRGKRLGVVRKAFAWHPEIERQMNDVLRALAELGAELVDPIEIPHRHDYGDAEETVLLYEFKHDLELYLGALPDHGQPRSLAALIDFNRAHASEEMPWFGQELFEQAVGKGPLTEQGYLDALAQCGRLSREEGLDTLFAGKKLDALVSPTTDPAFLIDWINGDAYGGSITGPPAVAGYPHLTVPAGNVQGLPWGLSFLGPAWSEASLLAYGEAFERASRARRIPTLRATVDYSVGGLAGEEMARPLKAP